jgi:YHS domain-containing protein
MVHRIPTLLLILVALGCSPEPAQQAEATPSEAEASSEAKPAVEGVLTRVEPDLVCMINNQFMGVPQIAVEVEGTTYYGCCEMCKTRLVNEPESRTAIDPISGAKVDKAHAVIGKTDTGAVVYFENEKNLAAYVPPAA